MADTSGLAAVLRRGVEAGDVPGVVAAVGDRAGTIFEGGFGVRAIGGDAPMTPDTVCWIASMTKAVTAAAAMQLVEQGRLALDTPIADVLPYLARVQVLDGFDADGQARLRAPRRPITLRHLLTHASGFSYNMWNADIARYQKLHRIPNVGSGRDVALTTPLLFDPGERWEYGIGIDWVGKAVEAVSGQRLGAYMKAHIFNPLGMADTGFKLGESQAARRATVHTRGAAGLAATNIVTDQNPEFEGGGGGLYATAGDYLKFARMILNGGMLDGARVLQAETVAQMGRHAMGDVRARVMRTTDAGTTRDVAFTEGMQWGLSFMINPERSVTGRAAGSLAWAGLANSYYWIDPASGIAGVFLSQVMPFADPKVLALFHAFEAEAYKLH